MKSMSVLVVAVLLGAQFASAQDDWKTLNYKKPEKKMVVLLDGSSVLLKGAGFKGTYMVSDKLALGGLVKKFKLKSSDTDGSSSIGYNNYEHQITAVGLVADYYLTNTKSQAGVYISGALVSSKVETKVDDDYFGSNTAEDSTTGLQAKAGYQFVSQLNPSLDMLFQLGLGYGSAGSVKWSYSGSRTKLENGLQIDLSAGAQF